MQRAGASLLEPFPRVDLGHWPTPLEPCRRLQEDRGGPLIWLKRDDCSGLAFGGNKTRKLEFLLGEALARKASGVVTFGAIQSNHARQTAAACAHVGLPCDLVLTDAVDRPTDIYRSGGNRLLDDILGATVHLVADNDAALMRAGELAEADPGRYFIDPGGSSPTGALGYVAAALELTAQLGVAGLRPRELVVASSTGGTAAGLVVGLIAAGIDLPVTAVAVYADAAHTAGSIERLVGDTADLLSLDSSAAGAWRVDDRALGEGYGIETAGSHAAVLELARTEGVLLDPVYTAKAFASLLARTGDLDPGVDVVFLHTGGQPGVFAYADAFT
jgi:D-cysteine desulfhydrase family pyridoxal phosphate-dependent enzyme